MSKSIQIEKRRINTNIKFRKLLNIQKSKDHKNVLNWHKYCTILNFDVKNHVITITRDAQYKSLVT